MGEGYNLFDLSVEAITRRGPKWRLLWFAKKSFVTSLVKIRQVLNKGKDSIQSLTMFGKKVLTIGGCCANVTWMTVDGFVHKQTVFAILQFTEISRKLRDDKDEEGEGQGDTVVTKVPLKNSSNAHSLSIF